jgi:RNA 2',3'-cyclic 3'-phosphodiesterase
VNLPASVEGRDRARLFCALRLPTEVLETLSEWQEAHIRAGRPVVRDNLHITLAFLGHRPLGELDSILAAMREAAAAADPIRFVPDRYRETRSVGMLALTDLTEEAATHLADDLFGRLERAGVYEREQRRWLPHVTVVRFRERPRLSPPLPELGEFSPSDAAVYHSVLRSTGAQYVVVESFALGG